MVNLDYVASIESDILRNIIIYEIDEDRNRTFILELITDKLDYPTRVRITHATSLARCILSSGGEFSCLSFPGFSLERNRRVLSSIC